LVDRRKMDKNRRAKNEKEFDSWDELPGGGRRYYFDVKGKTGGTPGT
jgi:hypothetical protein